MRTSTKTLSVSAVAALALTLGACGADDATQPQERATSGGIQSEDVPGSADDTASPSANTTDAPESAMESDEDSGPNAGVYEAIDLAEAEVGGIAFEIDREDDGRGGWEVSVVVDGEEIDVHVNLAGTEVLRTDRDGDLDAEERAALDAATITLADAIRTALGEVDGVIDDVDLDDDEGTYAWEVDLDGDIEVYVSVTGEVLRVDRD